MNTRAFVGASTVTSEGVGLALAPALAPAGLVASPSFFHGFSAQPQVLARGLLTLADITATRYFQYTPSGLRDPVLTAQGDRLRAECFSACNSVYARLDLLSAGFDGGDIAYGTTNVDIGPSLRQALGAIRRSELLHVDIGDDGLRVSSLAATAVERPVAMPGRWVRALGNVAEMHRELSPLVVIDAATARRFVASVPPATAASQDAWVTTARAGFRVSARPVPGAVFLAGLHRLSAAKRLLPHLRGITFYGPADGSAGPAAVEIALPSARLTLGLTAQAWRGYSGEGALLAALATPTASDGADLISAVLAFEPVIDVTRLARQTSLDAPQVQAGLAVLSTSGRVGWDLHDEAHFHRELPDDPDRVAKDNPRLVSARRLVDTGAVIATSDVEWTVQGQGSATYFVKVTRDGQRCTCPWFLTHGDTRGPCKHLLAVQLSTQET